MEAYFCNKFEAVKVDMDSYSIYLSDSDISSFNIWRLEVSLVSGYTNLE
jgi:hypothetical protein